MSIKKSSLANTFYIGIVEIKKHLKKEMKLIREIVAKEILILQQSFLFYRKVRPIK